MIDKLKIRAIDFDIKQDNALIVERAPYSPSTSEVFGEHLLWKNDMGDVLGKRAHHNTEQYNVTLKKLTGAPQAFMFIEFNPTKYHDKANLQPITEKGLKDIFKSLESDLRDKGICFDITQAHISRLDAYRDLQTAESYESYSRLFDVMQGKRMRQRDYGSTRLWENGQHQFSVYDKLAEMRHHDLDTTNLPRTMRAEYRALTRAKVKKVYGFEQASDTLDNFDHVLQVYRKAMTDNIFKHDADEFKGEMLSSDQLKRELRYFKTHYGLRWTDEYVKARGVYGIVEDIGEKELFDSILEIELESDTLEATKRESVERRIRRTAVKLRGNIQDIALCAEHGQSMKPMSDLYTELREGFVACSA